VRRQLLRAFRDRHLIVDPHRRYPPLFPLLLL
jgi:hypothetical protein